MLSRSIYCILALVAAGFVPSSGQAASVVGPQVTSAVAAPLPLPYDPAADSRAQVASALERARASGKFVLLDFGGNWCPDCRILAGTLALAEVKPAVDRTFETVMIDVGRLTKNLDLAEAYHVRISAVPTVIVLDPMGRVVNSGNPSALSDARSMSAQAIVDTIFGWVKPAG